jgi:phosphoribosyl 1,2-cyclic phosphate phosphodiesterase
MRDLERVFRFAFNGENRFPGYMHPEPHIVDRPFMLGETTLIPLPVRHGRATVFGYLFVRGGESLIAYLSDCKTVPPEVLQQIAGVRHLIIDALRRKPHPTHLTVEEALQVVDEVRPEHAWLTHLCHDLCHAETEGTLPSSVRIAYDGLKLEA